MSSPVSTPSADAQLQFLSKLQRVFAEGDFTATYKFALLIALADLAVELGSDTDDQLVLTNRQIGERFVGLYWKHCLPYNSGRGVDMGVLVQNKGKQAAVVSSITAFREKSGIHSLQLASAHPEFGPLLTDVSRTVSDQPLNYLQNFGGGNDEFLFERFAIAKIRLKPGVAYCLRRFYPLVQQLARSHWIEHIKANRQNLHILGAARDLESFLFASSRQSLEIMGRGLRKIDGARCFYCGRSLTVIEVDHFIPFARYPRDLAHNFVLAHPGCNRSKSDTLAARVHLERWLDRLIRCQEDLTEIGLQAGLVTSGDVARRVGHWAYTNAAAAQAKAWIAANEYTPVDKTYVDCFGQLSVSIRSSVPRGLSPFHGLG
jgi:5-methylcytosine-specific restriction endonuclease McrA